jgi:hypothetical protein
MSTWSGLNKRELGGNERGFGMARMQTIIDMTLLTKQEDVDSETVIATYAASCTNGQWSYLYKKDFAGGIKTRVEIREDSNGPDQAEFVIETLAAFLKNFPRSGNCIDNVKIDCDVG